MKHVDPAVVGLGAAICIPLAIAIWRASSLRSDMFRNFQPRLALAQAGLDNNASDALRQLADRVNGLLGSNIGLEENFNPVQALADPGELRVIVDRVSAFMGARRRIPRHYRGLLLVGPLLLVTLIPTLLASLVALSYFTGLFRDRLVGYVGLWVGVGAFIASCVVGGMHMYCQMRFSGAELLSAPGSQ
jgi:hypothetical protein